MKINRNNLDSLTRKVCINPDSLGVAPTRHGAFTSVGRECDMGLLSMGQPHISATWITYKISNKRSKR